MHTKDTYLPTLVESDFTQRAYSLPGIVCTIL